MKMIAAMTLTAVTSNIRNSHNLSECKTFWKIWDHQPPLTIAPPDYARTLKGLDGTTVKSCPSVDDINLASHRSKALRVLVV